MINSDYGGTMTTENLAGKVSARIWPAFLKAKNNDERGLPTVMALSQELYTEMIKLVLSRQYSSKEHPPDPDTMMGMKLIYDSELAEGEWELRWAE